MARQDLRQQYGTRWEEDCGCCARLDRQTHARRELDADAVRRHCHAGILPGRPLRTVSGALHHGVRVYRVWYRHDYSVVGGPGLA
jgi:hypothetical protein